MRNVDLNTIIEAAVASFDGLPDARQRQLVQGLLQALHGYAKGVQLTHAEWRAGLAFLHRVGDISSDTRSEFSLLSDVTGFSSLIDMLASDPADGAVTPGSNLGPFHASGSPWKDNPANLIADNAGRRVLLRGRVVNQHGQPLPQATLDFWQNAADGLYWQQDPGKPSDNLRCQLRMDSEGAFAIATIRPVPYQIPLDGPVWHDLVQPAGLTGWRPAHYHLIVQAPGHRTLVTELFDSEDPYLDRDAVFGVREALVGRYQAVNDAAACALLGLPGPDCLVMDVVLRLSPARLNAA
jgi:catechol 1,2-dioxygenase/hydroxyquinol 1,2-dioxygenase